METFLFLRKLPKEIDTNKQCEMICICMGFSWVLNKLAIAPTITESQLMSIHEILNNFFAINKRFIAEIIEVKQEALATKIIPERLSFLSRSRQLFLLGMLKHFNNNAAYWTQFSLLLKTFHISLKTSLFNYVFSFERLFLDDSEIVPEKEEELISLCKGLIILKLLAKGIKELQYKLLKSVLRLAEIRIKLAHQSFILENFEFLICDIISDISEEVNYYYFIVLLGTFSKIASAFRPK